MFLNKLWRENRGPQASPVLWKIAGTRIKHKVAEKIVAESSFVEDYGTRFCRCALFLRRRQPLP
jgi:hypothetical protein